MSTDGEIARALGKLEGEMNSFRHEVLQRMDKMEDKIEEIEKTASRGEGALWLFLRLGTVAGLLMASAAALYYVFAGDNQRG